VFIPLSHFASINQQLEQAPGGKGFANPRNLAAGSIRLLEPEVVRQRGLRLLAYQVGAAAAAEAPPEPAGRQGARCVWLGTLSLRALAGTCWGVCSELTAPPPALQVLLPPSEAGGSGSDGSGASRYLSPSHWQSLQWLQQQGFAVNPDNQLLPSFEQAMQAADAWRGRRAQLGAQGRSLSALSPGSLLAQALPGPCRATTRPCPAPPPPPCPADYHADGVVLKLDSTALQEQLGDNGVDPRWALAWKFAGAVAATQLLVRAGSRRRRACEHCCTRRMHLLPQSCLR
jgi:DNA ligase (NAD+)